MKKNAEENKEIEVPYLVGRKYEDVVEEYSKQGIEIEKEKVEYSDFSKFIANESRHKIQPFIKKL